MKKILKVQGLDCANCAAKIERAIKKLPDVTEVRVNFMSMRMTLEAPDNLFDSLLEEAKRLADKIEPGIVIS